MKLETEAVETDVMTVEEKMNNGDDSIGDNEGDSSEEFQTIIEQLEGIMVEGRTGDGFMFKKVDKKVLKVQGISVKDLE